MSDESADVQRAGVSISTPALIAATVALRVGDLAATARGGRVSVGSCAPLRCLQEGISVWDAHWYAGIAAAGYEYVRGADSNVAFFPGYPLLMRYGAALGGGNYLLAGLMISLVAGIAGVMLLKNLAGLDFGAAAGSRAALLLAAAPTAFFLAVPYADALLLLLVLLTFVGARRRIWWLACLAAGLAGGVRITGLALVVPVLWEMGEALDWSVRKVLSAAGLRVVGWIPLAVAGATAWGIWLGVRFGEPLASVKAQFAGWPHERTWVLEPVRQTIVWLMQPSGFLSGTRPDLWWAYLLDIVTLAVMAALAIAARHKLIGSYWLWWGIVVAISLMTGTTNSLARYALTVFPMFIAAAVVLRRGRFIWPVIGAGVLAQLVAAYHFGMGWWVG